MATPVPGPARATRILGATTTVIGGLFVAGGVAWMPFYAAGGASPADMLARPGHWLPVTLFTVAVGACMAWYGRKLLRAERIGVRGVLELIALYAVAALFAWFGLVDPVLRPFPA